MTSVTKILAITAALFVMVVSGAFAQSKDAEAPDAQRLGGQATISTQMNAFKSRDHAKAFNQATPNLQKLFGSTDRFIGMASFGASAKADRLYEHFGITVSAIEDTAREMLAAIGD